MSDDIDAFCLAVIGKKVSHSWSPDTLDLPDHNTTNSHNFCLNRNVLKLYYIDLDV